MKKSSKDAEKDYLSRTIIVEPFQKQELSSLARKVQHFQARMFNIGVESGCKEWYDNKKANRLITRLRKENRWMKDFSRDLATTAFMQGYDAVDKWLYSNKIKKGIRLWGKELAGMNHGWSEKLHIKPNRWSEYKSLFRNEDAFKHGAVVSYGQHPSFRVLKWGKIELNLPGMGKIIIKDKFDDFAPRYLTLDKSTGGAKSVRGFYHSNIVSYQLVETTKKFTVRTNNDNRTYEIHLNLRIDKPVKEKPYVEDPMYAAEEPEIITGVDRGVKVQAVTYDGVDEKHYEIPDDCKRYKNDPISIQQGIRDLFVHHSNNWWKVDRKLWKMRDDLMNKRINHDRHLAKLIASKTDVICIESLNIKSMTKYKRWLKALNREIYYAGMGKFGKTLIQSCENLGVKVLLIMAHYTSITCCRCNYIDRKSRISRDKFKCTHCKFECNADLNAAINIRWYGLPCIRKMPEFDYYGNYVHNDSSINLANSNVNCVKHGTGGDGGGWERRPGESSGGSDDEYSKTGGSRVGLHQSMKNMTKTDVIKDPLDCQKKI